MAIPAAWSVVALLGVTSPALAEECRLALVLALDVSSSVDAHEDRLQREGLAQALVAPEVVRAFLTGDPVALYVFEWSGRDAQTPILQDWEMVRAEADLTRIAGLIVASPRSAGNQSTATGAALLYAAAALRSGPDCRARTIDVSSDGESNNGPLPEVAYQNSVFDSVTVNALVIGGVEGGRTPTEDRRLVAWFGAHVRHGPGAFCLLASSYEDYEQAMEAKLLRELERPVVSGLPRFADEV